LLKSRNESVSKVNFGLVDSSTEIEEFGLLHLLLVAPAFTPKPFGIQWVDRNKVLGEVKQILVHEHKTLTTSVEHELLVLGLKSVTVKALSEHGQIGQDEGSEVIGEASLFQLEDPVI